MPNAPTTDQPKQIGTSITQTHRGIMDLPPDILLDIFKIVNEDAVRIRQRHDAKTLSYLPSGISQFHESSNVARAFVGLMRVCSLFHDLVAPLVYTHAVVDNPAQLLYGINHTSTGRLSKIETLSFIERLGLTHSKTATTYSPLVVGHDFASHKLSRKCRSLLKSYLSSLDFTKQAKHMLTEYNQSHPDTPVILPNLSHLRLITFDERLEGEGHRLFGREPIPACYDEVILAGTPIGELCTDRHLITQSFGAGLRQATTPLHVCDHSFTAPGSYDLIANSKIGPLPITYTAMISRWNHKYYNPIPILIGSTTRLMVDDQGHGGQLGSLLTSIWGLVLAVPASETNLSRYLVHLRESLAITIKKMNHRAVSKSSRVIIYLPGDRVVLQTALAVLRPNQPRPLMNMTTDELLQSAAQYLRGHTVWSARKVQIRLEVKFKSMAGDCPGCGEKWV